MANVYWIKGRARSIYQSAVSKIGRLLELPEFARLLVPEESLALKINLSELGYSHYLPPVLVATLFENLRSRGIRPVVTDSGSLFKGSRFNGFDWTNTALVTGFSPGETFHNQVLLAGGYTNEEGRFFESEGEHLGGVELGSLLTDTGNLAVLSHVTAHPLLGLCGAMCNLGMGLLTMTGKSRIHSFIEIEYDEEKCNNCLACLPYCPTGAIQAADPKISFHRDICTGCLGCFMTCPESAFRVKPEGIQDFQESVVEAAHTAVHHLRGGAFFINFLTSVTPQTDEYPFSDVPFIPDLGILASEDPVAVDWVTYQMITRSPGVPGSIADTLNVLDKGRDKLLAVTGQDPTHWIQYAETMNLGSRECSFLAGS
ncbi:MAG: DUF362 domain-containing protein [Pseudomonadota bacterium]